MQKVTKTVTNVGTTFYCNKNGQLHNGTGPAVIYKDGSVQYYINGKYHRTDGPAVIYKDGTVEYYYINGKYHRTDGPAVIYKDGTVEYYINGKYINSLKKFQKLSKSTEEDMTAMILKYGHDGFTKP